LIIPGAMALTRMFFGAHACAICLHKPSRAVLLTQYAPTICKDSKQPMKLPPLWQTTEHLETVPSKALGNLFLATGWLIIGIHYLHSVSTAAPLTHLGSMFQFNWNRNPVIIWKSDM